MCSTLQAGAWRGDGCEPLSGRLEDRLAMMEDALPPGAQARSGLSDEAWHLAEPERLCAFENGEADWWLARGESTA